MRRRKKVLLSRMTAGAFLRFCRITPKEMPSEALLKMSKCPSQRKTPEMSAFYILKDKVPVRVRLLEWARWFEGSERFVARDEINGVSVSTVFLGVDHRLGSGG